MSDDGKKKATIDDLVQELKWLNQNVGRMVLLQQREAKTEAKIGKLFTGFGLFCIITSIAAFLLHVMRQEQEIALAALKGVPYQESHTSSGYWLLAGVIITLYGTAKLNRVSPVDSPKLDR